MKLYELFDEDHYSWSLLYDLSLAKEELLAYYKLCNGDIDCVFDKLVNFNKSFQYIVNHRGRETGKRLLLYHLRKYGIKTETDERQSV